MTCWLTPMLGMSRSLLQLTHGREAIGASSRLSNEIVKGGPDVAMKSSRQILDGNPPKSTSAGKNLLGTICPAPDRGPPVARGRAEVRQASETATAGSGTARTGFARDDAVRHARAS